ncbi:hypothetical protein T484DRAFT_1921647, partial [Baffinella frigidus]
MRTGNGAGANRRRSSTTSTPSSAALVVLQRRVAVKKEEEDDIPLTLLQSAEQFVTGHPALRTLWLFIHKGRGGTQACGFNMLSGGEYVAEQEGTLAICNAMDAVEPSKKAPKLLTDAIAGSKLPGVSKGPAERSRKLWFRTAASFLRITRWTDETLALAIAGIKDKSHAKTILELAPPAKEVQQENGGVLGSPSPTSSRSPPPPSPASSPIPRTPAEDELLSDSPSPTQHHAYTPSYSPSSSQRAEEMEDGRDGSPAAAVRSLFEAEDDVPHAPSASTRPDPIAPSQDAAQDVAPAEASGADAPSGSPRPDLDVASPRPDLDVA